MFLRFCCSLIHVGFPWEYMRESVPEELDILPPLKESEYDMADYNSRMLSTCPSKKSPQICALPSLRSALPIGQQEIVCKELKYPFANMILETYTALER